MTKYKMIAWGSNSVTNAAHSNLLGFYSDAIESALNQDDSGKEVLL